ncbi:MAG: polyprenyl synthetase family protein [bacterium]|nr:polyprenyl synthetase family protein [bacterium]
MNKSPKAYYDELVEKINNELNNAVTEEFPQDLYKPMKYVLSARGKRFRPIMSIWACEAVGGTRNDAFNASLALEILHNFTLVHDDIMDDDDLRRGRETVHKKWNENIAILAGDGLIALAYRHLLRSETPDLQELVGIFSEAIITICEGQSLDKDLESREDTSLEEYYDMIRRKTAVLISVSAGIGSLLGRAEPDVRSAVTEFAMDLGLAFQIQDDLLDIISEEEIIGKDIGSDLAQGKKTYPIILFNQRADKKTRDKLYKNFLNSRPTSEKMKLAGDVFGEFGIVEDTYKEFSMLIERANNRLGSISDKIDSKYLLHLSDMIKNRRH